MLHDYALYKSTIDTDTDIQGHRPHFLESRPTKCGKLNISHNVNKAQVGVASVGMALNNYISKQLSSKDNGLCWCKISVCYLAVSATVHH